MESSRPCECSAASFFSSVEVTKEFVSAITGESHAAKRPAGTSTAARAAPIFGTSARPAPPNAQRATAKPASGTHTRTA